MTTPKYTVPPENTPDSLEDRLDTIERQTASLKEDLREMSKMVGLTLNYVREIAKAHGVTPQLDLFERPSNGASNGQQ